MSLNPLEETGELRKVRKGGKSYAIIHDKFAFSLDNNNKFDYYEGSKEFYVNEDYTSSIGLLDDFLIKTDITKDFKISDDTVKKFYKYDHKGPKLTVNIDEVPNLREWIKKNNDNPRRTKINIEDYEDNVNTRDCVRFAEYTITRDNDYFEDPDYSPPAVFKENNTNYMIGNVSNRFSKFVNDYLPEYIFNKEDKDSILEFLSHETHNIIHKELSKITDYNNDTVSPSEGEAFMFLAHTRLEEKASTYHGASVMLRIGDFAITYEAIAPTNIHDDTPKRTVNAMIKPTNPAICIYYVPKEDTIDNITRIHKKYGINTFYRETFVSFEHLCDDEQTCFATILKPIKYNSKGKIKDDTVKSFPPIHLNPTKSGDRLTMFNYFFQAYKVLYEHDDDQSKIYNELFLPLIIVEKPDITEEATLVYDTHIKPFISGMKSPSVKSTESTTTPGRRYTLKHKNRNSNKQTRKHNKV